MSHVSPSPSAMDHTHGPEFAVHQHPAPSAHHHGGVSGWRAAAMVTLHCLTGCLVGEWVGLAIGVALSLPRGFTALLATLLAYASGFGLTIWPLLRSGMSFRPALAMVFVGEAVSIGVMEVAMNAVDFAMGGMGVKSLLAPRYWVALAVAAVAGFLGAWPVNFWLLGRNMKKCHHGPDIAQRPGLSESSDPGVRHVVPERNGSTGPTRTSDVSRQNHRGAKSRHDEQQAAQRGGDEGAMSEGPRGKRDQAAAGK